ncbi:MAG: hypothetical protein MJ107_05540 [Lachnospiraceae bacterium]|nr:hypothetical protein [Lachnospiraceae bacterium]
MSIIDQLINSAANQVKSSLKGVARSAEYSAKQKGKETLEKAKASALSKKVEFTFEKIPDTLEEFKALPEVSKLTDPFATTALTIVAYAAYAKNKAEGLAMFNVLRGPAPFSNLDISRTDDSLKGRTYIPMSYFEGATVENNYTPSVPYKVVVIQTSHTDDTLSEGYKRMFVKSAGADTERYITLRTKASTKEWFLSEHAGITSSIRVPQNENPWA